MTEALYFLDCYLKEFKATVEKVTDDKFLVIDRTAFYPEKVIYGQLFRKCGFCVY